MPKVNGDGEGQLRTVTLKPTPMADSKTKKNVKKTGKKTGTAQVIPVAIPIKPKLI